MPQPLRDIRSGHIRVSWASPLRVATCGDANWSSEVGRRRSPAHANRRRDFGVLPKNPSLYVELYGGKDSFRLKSLKGIALFSLDFRARGQFSGNGVAPLFGAQFLGLCLESPSGGRGSQKLSDDAEPKMSPALSHDG